MSYPKEKMITCLLSSELQHVNIGIVALSEVWRLAGGWLQPSWRVVTPTAGLVDLKVPMPKEL